MTKALWLTVAQCCGGKENKEAASAAAAAVCGKEEGVRDEALVLLLSVDNQQNWRHRKEEDVNLNFVFNIERIRSFGTRMGGV